MDPGVESSSEDKVPKRLKVELVEYAGMSGPQLKLSAAATV
jgi:hypothetical protein